MMAELMKVIVLAAAMGLGGAILAQEAGGKPSGGDPTKCSAGLKDLAWLEGRWGGSLAVGAFELEYSAPSGGVITSMFRLLPEGRASMLEFACLRETVDGLEFRFRHFGTDLVGWEEKDAPIVMRCVACAEHSWTFENVRDDRPKQTVITRVANDEYTFKTQIGTGESARFMEGAVQRIK